MQIIIEIPESEIPKHQDIIEIPIHFIDGKICEAGGYGFAELPKGHGDLIDRKELIEGGINKGFCDWYDEIKYAPTIIEAESDHKCHNCKHYMSGEYDGSCDSYICEHYSGWEARDKG